MAENILFVPLHLSIGGYLGYFNSLIIMNNDAMNTRTNYCGDACFNFVGIYREAELLNDMITLCLTFF